MSVSIFFSAFIYNVLSQEVERFARAQRVRIERELNEPILPPLPPNGVPEPELVSAVEHRIFVVLLFLNGGIFIVSGALGYFLAGKTLRPIKAMVDEQNRFISDASHELRTPLTGLKSSMEVFLRDKNSSLDEAKELFKENVLEVNKLQYLSDSLLQLAQYQKPINLERYKKISILKVIENSITKIKPLAKEKEIIINNLVKEQNVYGNEFSLADLFTILLDNAIKYSNKNSKIELNSKKEGGYLVVWVKDFGIGIDKKDKPHIFDRFFRADTTRFKIDASGYGLGLSIAKEIVARHNGSIYLESKLGKGTTFYIKLPINVRNKVKEVS